MQNALHIIGKVMLTYLPWETVKNTRRQAGGGLFLSWMAPSFEVFGSSINTCVPYVECASNSAAVLHRVYRCFFAIASIIQLTAWRRRPCMPCHAIKAAPLQHTQYVAHGVCRPRPNNTRR